MRIPFASRREVRSNAPGAVQKLPLAGGLATTKLTFPRWHRYSQLCREKRGQFRLACSRRGFSLEHAGALFKLISIQRVNRPSKLKCLLLSPLFQSERLRGARV